MNSERMEVDDVALAHDEDDMMANAATAATATASQSGPWTGAASSTRSRAKARRVLTHRCRFPDWAPGAIHALAITPSSFDSSLLGYGGVSGERGMIAVGRSNGDVELMLWGGHQGWVTYRTLPCSFPMPQTRNSKKPSTLLSHLVFAHQTTLSPSDIELYDGDLEGAHRGLRRLQREGLRLFGVGGVGSELVEWEWGGPGATKEVGRIKSTLPTLPPIFALAASRSSANLAIGCEDSTIRILNILDNELELVAKIEIGGPGKVRPLSLAWGPLRPAADAASKTSDKGKERDESPSAPSALPQQFATPRESYVVAGCSNSSIRRFDAPTSGAVAGIWRSVHRMTLDQLRGEHTVVWAVSALQDGTIVSGDSMGNVKFWDAEMGTQTQSFKSHKADVLALAIGADGTSVFTSGVDQKTVEFRLVTISSSRSNSSASRRWIQASGRRLHSHDVRAMVVSPPYTLALPSPPSTSPRTAQVPILTSGGFDLSLITVCVSPVPARTIKSARSLTNPISDHRSIEYETTVHRRAAYVPQRSKPFAVAGQGEARWLICQRDRGVAIWKLDEPKLQRGSTQGRSGWKARQDHLDGVQEEMDDDEDNTTGWAKAAELELKLHTNLIASAISPDGRWLAVSDLYETKLFRLEMRNGDLSPRRQKMFSSALSDALPTSLGTGSAQLAFTADSQRLVLASSFGSSIAVVELPMDREKSFHVSKVFGQHNEHRGDREFRAMPNGVNGVNGVNGGADSESGSDSDSDDDDEEKSNRASSSDRPATVVCLAISPDGKWLASADLERKVCVFDLENLKHHTTLPTPTHVPSALEFIPSSSSLVIALPTNSMSVFDLKSLRFHPWALPLSKLSANTLTDLREPILGLTFEPRSEATDLSSSMSNKVHPSRRVTTHQNEQLGLAWGANWVGTIDFDALSKGTNASGKKAPLRRDVDKKRAREEDVASGAVGGDNDEEPKLDIRTTRKYQPLVLFDFVTHGELIAVERTWQDLSQGLRLFRLPRFGDKSIAHIAKMTTSALLKTECPTLELIARGKVRDIYRVPGHDEALLFVATDRVSAFDVIMKNGIPNKGKLLTALSLFFFNLLATSPETKHIPNHVITSTLSEMPKEVQQYADQLEGRSIWVRKAEILPVEAIVRGYITGSAWVEYQKSGTMHGMELPKDLKESTRLDPPLFTPSTKAEVGDKDENIHPDQLKTHIDPSYAGPLADYALALYSTAAKHSASKGLILADTKFEFGLLPASPDDPTGRRTLMLVDECLTPDSSRFWPASTWAEGNKMVGFDKQFLREWLKSGGGGFGSKGGGIEEDGVEIPEDIVQATWQKYEEAFELLTGKKFEC